jgi:hypothetical protein
VLRRVGAFATYVKNTVKRQAQRSNAVEFLPFGRGCPMTQDRVRKLLYFRFAPLIREAQSFVLNDVFFARSLSSASSLRC